MTRELPSTFRPQSMLAALAAEEARYVVIGGTAAVIQGAGHVTFDLDITPDRELENLERVATALRKLGASVYGMPEDARASFRLDGETLRQGSTWKFLTDHGELDIVLDPDGTTGYADLARGASRSEIGGKTVLVASLEDVIRSKEAAGRERDRAMLADLRRTLELKRQHDAG